MVDLDRIDNCSVSRIIQHNGEELEQNWVRSPSELQKTHCATEEDEAVVLAPHNPNEIKQKWTFELNSDGTSTIKSLFNELTLSQIVDSYRNDKVSIGTKAALGQDKQKWSLSIVY